MKNHNIITIDAGKFQTKGLYKGKGVRFRAKMEEIDPFTVEEAMKLKQWESLNVIRHSNQYSNFISTLPTPLN